MFVKEPERWRAIRDKAPPARLRDLFSRETIGITARGTLMAMIALLTWWSCSAFLPTIASGLAREAAQAAAMDRFGTLSLVESWKAQASTGFNLGGLAGTLITIPIAKSLGRKPMFALYFGVSAASIFLAFGFSWPWSLQLVLYFCIGVSVFCVFGSFTFYLPELFPTRLRGTGSGFCYNIGRVLAAAGPLLVGTIAAGGLDHAMRAISIVAIVPLAGLLLIPLVTETRGRGLLD